LRKIDLLNENLASVDPAFGRSKTLCTISLCNLKDRHVLVVFCNYQRPTTEGRLLSIVKIKFKVYTGTVQLNMKISHEILLCTLSIQVAQ